MVDAEQQTSYLSFRVWLSAILIDCPDKAGRLNEHRNHFVESVERDVPAPR